MKEIKPTIRDYIEKNFLLTHGSKLNDGDSLLQMQILDSTGFLELVGFIESSFGVKIEDDEMIPENLETIDSIAAFVALKLVS